MRISPRLPLNLPEPIQISTRWPSRITTRSFSGSQETVPESRSISPCTVGVNKKVSAPGLIVMVTRCFAPAGSAPATEHNVTAPMRIANPVRLTLILVSPQRLFDSSEVDNGAIGDGGWMDPPSVSPQG
jgi:hypothetical protein